RPHRGAADARARGRRRSGAGAAVEAGSGGVPTLRGVPGEDYAEDSPVRGGAAGIARRRASSDCPKGRWRGRKPVHVSRVDRHVEDITANKGTAAGRRSSEWFRHTQSIEPELPEWLRDAYDGDEVKRDPYLPSRQCFLNLGVDGHGTSALHCISR